MSYVTVAVVPVGPDRFALVLSDPAAAPSHGPSVGDDPQGYTEDELRRSLNECHGLSTADIAMLIAATLLHGSADSNNDPTVGLQPILRGCIPDVRT